MMDNQLTLSDIKGIIRRRKKSFALIICLIIGSFGIIAFSLPSIYQSKVEILIEGQQIPEDYVRSTSTTFAEQKLQKISRQVMAYSKLMALIEKYKLYPELTAEGNISSAVSEFHSSVTLETTDTKIGNRNITSAFTIAYEGRDAKKVQLVTNELANMYVVEESKARDVSSEATTGFLSEELENMKALIQEQENRISTFKAAHFGELPEDSSTNLQTIARLERELEVNTARIRSLEERKIYLNGQLASVEPLKPIQTEEGKLTQNPSEQLKILRLRLISLQSRLSDKHPDIKKLKSEIAKLETQVGGGDKLSDKIRYLKDKNTKLAELRSRYGEKHPDVKRLKREIERLNNEIEQLKNNPRSAAGSSRQTQPDNPVYINLMTQVVSAETEIKNLKEDVTSIEEDLELYREKISKAPVVEKEYNELTLDYHNAKQKYNEMLNKLLEAKLSKGMEEKQQGEKFTITSPAYLPTKPSKPNRLAILLMGFVLAFGAGIGYVAVAERMDRTIKDEKELERFADLPILTSLSYVETNEERKSRRFKKVFIGIGIICAALVILIIVSNLLSPIPKL
jgi:polysaccharide biosynthesis transport protein